MTTLDTRAAPPDPERAETVVDASGDGRPSHVLRRSAGRFGWVYPLGALAVLVVCWHFAIARFDVEEYVLPAPGDVVTALRDNRASLQDNLVVTAGEAMAGLGLATLVGVALAVAIVYVPIFGRSVYPLIVASQVVPKVALAPTFLIWFGFGWAPKIVIAALMAVFPIIVDTALGLARVDPHLVHLVRSMTRSRWKAFWKIRFRYALPHFFAGFKVASTLAVLGAVVGEFVGSDRGLGFVILQASNTLDTALVFAALAILAAFGIAVYAAIEALEYAMTRTRAR